MCCYNGLEERVVCDQQTRSDDQESLDAEVVPVHAI
jgi:hypothetical protein